MSRQNPTSADSAARANAPVDTALFSQVEQLIQRVRLTQDERVAVETAGVASEVHVARKEFEMSHLDQAARIILRVTNSFDQCVTQWENQARRKEQQKQGMSMLQIRKMQAENTGVRTRVQLVKAQLRKLRIGLDQMEKMAWSQPAEPPSAAAPDAAAPAVEAPPAEPVAASSSSAAPRPSQLPAGFLEAYQAACDPRERTEVVRQYFEVEAELTVEIRRDGDQDRACFAPFATPPLNRFYFLAGTAQIIRTRRARIVDAVHVHYPDTGRNERLALKDFVRHVHRGVWLLRPRAPGPLPAHSPS